MTPPPEAHDDGAGVAAIYFDGKTARRHQVCLSVRGDMALLTGEAERACPLAQLRLSERSVHAVRKVTFPDGAYLEVRAADALARLLEHTGHRDGWIVRLQHSWRGALAALAITAVALVAGYAWLLPPLADLAARALPLAVERRLGDGMLDILDQHVFQPSALTPARQRALAAAFDALKPPLAGAPAHRIVFRQSRIGPNAFALPSGDIVLTDEMVKLLQPDEQALMGVLAHELGHLHQRHLARRVIQGSMVAAGASVVLGDVSTIVAGLPPLLLDLKYARDAEREADDYALAMLRANGIDADHLAEVFVRLGKLDAGMAPYLSSHPASAERIARIRAGADGQR